MSSTSTTPRKTQGITTTKSLLPEIKENHNIAEQRVIKLKVTHSLSYCAVLFLAIFPQFNLLKIVSARNSFPLVLSAVFPHYKVHYRYVLVNLFLRVFLCYVSLTCHCMCSMKCSLRHLVSFNFLASCLESNTSQTVQ